MINRHEGIAQQELGTRRPEEETGQQEQGNSRYEEETGQLDLGSGQCGEKDVTIQGGSNQVDEGQHDLIGGDLLRGDASGLIEIGQGKNSILLAIFTSSHSHRLSTLLALVIGEVNVHKREMSVGRGGKGHDDLKVALSMSIRQRDLQEEPNALTEGDAQMTKSSTKGARARTMIGRSTMTGGTIRMILYYKQRGSPQTTLPQKERHPNLEQIVPKATIITQIETPQEITSKTATTTGGIADTREVGIAVTIDPPPTTIKIKEEDMMDVIVTGRR